MKKVKLARMSCAVVLFGAGFAGTRDYAQQATPAGPAKTPAPSGAAKSNGAPDPAGTASAPPDKVVIKVGDQQVTVADFDFLLHSLNAQDQKTIATQGRQPLVDQYVLTLMLEQQAVRDRLDVTPEFRRQEALERAQRLAQAEYAKIAQDVQVTPQEISQYYQAHPDDFEQLAVRQIGIRKKAEGATAPGLSAEEAKTRAEAIRKALAAGTDPQKVAKDFAVPNVVFVDPQERNIQRGKLSPELEQAWFKLKDGEVSEPLDTPQSLGFVQVVRHVHMELKDASPQVESVLRQQKLQARIAELKKATAVWSDQDYFKAPPAQKPAAGPAAPPASSPQPPTAPESASTPPGTQQPPKR
jgi:peptidyl-prolyl cis-trans isomerase C